MATSRQTRVAKAQGIAPPPPASATEGAPIGAPVPAKPRVRVKAVSVPTARSEFLWSNRAINQPFEALDPDQKLPRPPNVGPNGTIQSAPIFLGMSRKLFRDDAKVRKGLRSIAGKVVSKGPLPCPRFPELQEIIRAWLPQADARGRDSWAGLLKRIYLAERVDGELFIRLRRRFVSDGLVLPLQLQLLETDHVPVTWTWPKGAKGPNRIVQGIELDPIDRPAAYWMYQVHPHDWVMQSTDPETVTKAAMPDRIDAREVLHFANPIRAAGLRADSTIIPMLVTAHNLNSWDQAEQARKLVSSLFAGYIKRLPGEQGGNVIGEEEDPEAVDRAIKKLVLEPGVLAELPAGMDINWSDPPDTGASYEPFTRWKHMYMASCCDVSYEDFSGDWRGANDRTWRAGEVQTRIFVDGERDRIERQILQPLYRALVKLAIEMGLWAPPAGTPPHHVFDCRWTWPGSKNPNEYQEWNAFALAVQNGFMSRDEAIEATGGDPIEVDRRNGEGLARAKRMGLNYASYLPPAGAPAAGMGHNGGPALDDDAAPGSDGKPGPGGATGQAARPDPFEAMIAQIVERTLGDRLRQLVADGGGGDRAVPADSDGAGD